jgi:hypothetical protein
LCRALVFGIAVEVPIGVIVPARIGVVSIAQLRKWRGYFIVGAFAAAAVVTPPDVISLLSLALPMCVLDELGISAAQFFIKHSQAPEDKPASAARAVTTAAAWSACAGLGRSRPGSALQWGVTTPVKSNFLCAERGPSPRHRLKDTDPRQELGPEFPVRDSNVVLGLQIQPEPGLPAEEQSEPKRRVRCDRALPVHQLADPAGRDVDVRRELASADAHRLHEILQQDFARMNFFEQRDHVRNS